jgi:hypothetical protein
MVVNFDSVEFGSMQVEVALKVDSLVSSVETAMIPADYTTLEGGTYPRTTFLCAVRRLTSYNTTSGVMTLSVLILHALRWNEFCPLFMRSGGMALPHTDDRCPMQRFALISDLLRVNACTRLLHSARSGHGLHERSAPARRTRTMASGTHPRALVCLWRAMIICNQALALTRHVALCAHSLFVSGGSDPRPILRLRRWTISSGSPGPTERRYLDEACPPLLSLAPRTLSACNVLQDDDDLVGTPQNREGDEASNDVHLLFGRLDIRKIATGFPSLCACGGACVTSSTEN